MIVFLLAKEEARYKQPTDVQKPTASYAAVLTGRCTGAETVVCRCSDTGSSFFCRSKNYQDYIHVYSACVQRMCTAHTYSIYYCSDTSSSFLCRSNNQTTCIRTK